MRGTFSWAFSLTLHTHVVSAHLNPAIISVPESSPDVTKHPQGECPLLNALGMHFRLDWCGNHFCRQIHAEARESWAVLLWQERHHRSQPERVPGLHGCVLTAQWPQWALSWAVSSPGSGTAQAWDDPCEWRLLQCPNTAISSCSEHDTRARPLKAFPVHCPGLPHLDLAQGSVHTIFRSFLKFKPLCILLLCPLAWTQPQVCSLSPALFP